MGCPRQAFFHKSDKTEQLIVSTKQNVFASLSTANGDLSKFFNIWLHVFNEKAWFNFSHFGALYMPLVVQNNISKNFLSAKIKPGSCGSGVGARLSKTPHISRHDL